MSNPKNQPSFDDLNAVEREVYLEKLHESCLPNASDEVVSAWKEIESHPFVGTPVLPQQEPVKEELACPTIPLPPHMEGATFKEFTSNGAAHFTRPNPDGIDGFDHFMVSVWSASSLSSEKQKALEDKLFKEPAEEGPTGPAPFSASIGEGATVAAPPVDPMLNMPALDRAATEIFSKMGEIAQFHGCGVLSIVFDATGGYRFAGPLNPTMAIGLLKRVMNRIDEQSR